MHAWLTLCLPAFFLFADPFEDPAHPHSLAHTIGNVIAGRVRQVSPELMSDDCRRVIAGLLRLDPKARTTLQVRSGLPVCT